MEEGSGRPKRPVSQAVISPPIPAPPPHSSGGSEEEEEQQQQQMERFHALLANIRAMRDLRRGDGRKRPRSEGSLLWRPTFEWQDFRPVSGVGSTEGLSDRVNGKEKEEGGGEESSLDLRLAL